MSYIASYNRILRAHILTVPSSHWAISTSHMTVLLSHFVIPLSFTHIGWFHRHIGQLWQYFFSYLIVPLFFYLYWMASQYHHHVWSYFCPDFLIFLLTLNDTNFTLGNTNIRYNSIIITLHGFLIFYSH